MLGDYFVIGNPALNIMGAPISTALCYWLIAVINLFHIRRLTGSLPPIGKTVCRPLAATIGMSAAIFIVQRVLNGALNAAPGTMLDKLITLACIGVAVACMPFCCSHLVQSSGMMFCCCPRARKSQIFTSKVIRKCKNG